MQTTCKTCQRCVFQSSQLLHSLEASGSSPEQCRDPARLARVLVNEIARHRPTHLCPSPKREECGLVISWPAHGGQAREVTIAKPLRAELCGSQLQGVETACKPPVKPASAAFSGRLLPGATFLHKASWAWALDSPRSPSTDGSSAQGHGSVSRRLRPMCTSVFKECVWEWISQELALATCLQTKGKLKEQGSGQKALIGQLACSVDDWGQPLHDTALASWLIILSMIVQLQQFTWWSLWWKRDA